MTLVWRGGTQELQNFVGRRIRVLNQVEAPIHDPGRIAHPNSDPPKIQLTKGRIGMLTNAKMDDIWVAFPNNPSIVVTSIGAMMKIPFTAVVVNQPTLKYQFEIEV